MVYKLIWQGTTVTVLMQIVGVDDELITPASVPTILRRRVMLADSTIRGSVDVVVDTGIPLVPGDCVFSPPLTDNGWTHATGYNFRDRFVVASNGVLQVSYTFTDVNGLPLVTAINIPVTQVH